MFDKVVIDMLLQGILAVSYTHLTLRSMGGLKGMNFGKSGQGGDFFVDFRVVFHGTRA